MKAASFALFALLALLLAACGGGEGPSTVSPMASPVATATLPPPPTTAAAGEPTTAPSTTGVAVSFTTEDNVTIEGRLFGSGETAVVFAHMYPNDQRAWWDFASEVAADGYAALTFDFRGYGETGGSRDIGVIDRDLAAAVRYLREQGYQRVVLVGASMGGTAALKVAARDEFDGLVTGVVAVSAPESFQGLIASDDAGNIKVPIIFVASEGDGSAVDSLESLYEKASGSSERQSYVYTGDAHGTELLQSDHADEFKALLFEFFHTISLQ
jgi:dienelactone hydrolase